MQTLQTESTFPVPELDSAGHKRETSRPAATFYERRYQSAKGHAGVGVGLNVVQRCLLLACTG